MTDTTVELEMAPSDYTKEMWDKEFLCTFSVALEDDKLATKMLVENQGEEAFDFQAALHSYFTVSALDNLSIAGSFKGKEFLNKMVGDEGEMQTEEREEITIGEEYDRVYMGVNDPVLKDAGTGKTLTVANAAGYEDTVLWNPYGDEGMGYDNFVCVESVKVRRRRACTAGWVPCSDVRINAHELPVHDPRAASCVSSIPSRWKEALRGRETWRCKQASSKSRNLLKKLSLSLQASSKFNLEPRLCSGLLGRRWAPCPHTCQEIAQGTELNEICTK